MDIQDAENFNCSSTDLIKSVAYKLRYYVDVKRREDGFDTTPSAIPRRQFPKLLPRPMLMQTPLDIPLKHQFTHAQIRSLLGKIQSSKVASPPIKEIQIRRSKTIQRCFQRAFTDAADQPENLMSECDRTAIMQLHLNKEGKSTRVLRDGMRNLKRAPPPSIKQTEKQRLIRSSIQLLLRTEDGSRGTKHKVKELGNTKLQSLDQPSELQLNFMPSIHKLFTNASGRTRLKADPQFGKTRFIYDCHGRRQMLLAKSI